MKDAHPNFFRQYRRIMDPEGHSVLRSGIATQRHSVPWRGSFQGVFNHIDQNSLYKTGIRKNDHRYRCCRKHQHLTVPGIERLAVGGQGNQGIPGVAWRNGRLVFMGLDGHEFSLCFNDILHIPNGISQ